MDFHRQFFMLTSKSNLQFLYLRKQTPPHLDATQSRFPPQVRVDHPTGLSHGHLSLKYLSFSYDVGLALKAGKQAYENNGKPLNNPRVTSNILEKLTETRFGFTAYPTGVQILAVAEALVEKYPCLNEPGSFNGLYG